MGGLYTPTQRVISGFHSVALDMVNVVVMFVWMLGWNEFVVGK